MTTDTTYNGWTNYETWNVKLWMDNEYGDYCYWQEQIAAVKDEWTSEDDDILLFDKDSATYHLAEMLKDWVEENNPLSDASMYCDLLGAAISEVNWHEIAESMLED